MSATPALPQNPIALRLARLGLIPFFVLAALVWLIGDINLEAHAFVTLALSAYAALTISFLAGIQWGLAFRQTVPSPQPYVWALGPAFIAWIAVLMPAYAGLVLHGAMLIVGYLLDRRLYPALGASGWLNLRFRLSGLAALCCFLAAAGS